MPINKQWQNASKFSIFCQAENNLIFFFPFWLVISPQLPKLTSGQHATVYSNKSSGKSKINKQNRFIADIRKRRIPNFDPFLWRSQLSKFLCAITMRLRKCFASWLLMLWAATRPSESACPPASNSLLYGAHALDRRQIAHTHIFHRL